jgi:2-amino-4-hydroxy-6-hydroxymethyldihydropteridine diphosphokinase
MTASLHQVCLLLGSNIQPEKNIVLGVDLLREHVRVGRVSWVWETPPAESEGPNFLNLALLATTSLDAEELKTQVLRPLEARLGRVRSADKNAPRPIDYDIILYDGELLDPHLWDFAYRAVPVAELLPGYRSEQGELLRDAAERLAGGTNIRLREDVEVG